MEDNYIYDAIQVGALAASPAIYSYGKNKYDNKYSSFFQSAGRMLPGSEYLDQQLNTSTGLSLNSSSNGLQKSLLSSLMALEEMSPLHILRTLQLSNLIQPFTEISNNNQEIHIAGRQLRGQEAFYRALIEKESRDVKNKIKRELTSQDLTRGMYFLNNKIYGATAQGSINTSDVILDNARLVTATLKNGDIYSPNRLLEKYANTLGVTLNRAHMQENPLMFVGGSSSFKTDWARSALRYSMEVGYKTMDNPIAGVEELLGGLGAGNTKLFQTGAWRKLRDLAGNFQMGTQGDYTLSTRESLKRVAKNTAIRGGAAYVGYEVADSALRFLSPSDGIFSQGIATGVANIYASSRIAFAELWSDRFQGYRQRQEEQAPGSTSLTTLMAFPLAGALLGAQIGYFGRVGSASLKGIEKSASKYNVETTSKLLETVGFKKDALYKPMKRNALVGGLLGALPALPFLPGALIGESSEELRSLYSGEKDVLDKSNRGWFFGGQSIDGERPTRFKKHIVARMNADATDKVRYGDDATKKSFNPFLHPFSYLNDPYKYEKLHAEDTPYPIWGMDVSFGGIFGKAFERTVGQIIKPDIVNPALKDQIESQSILGLKTAPGKSLKKFIGEEVESSLDSSLTSSDRALIRSGLMKSSQMAGYTPNKEALDLTYQALSDFTGIKGWVGSLAIDSLGIDTEVSNQLARSGEATSSARDLQDLNIGDLFGLGEFQRKLLPTSAGALKERENPLINNSVSWLPKDSSKFYIDFGRGDPYSKISSGEERLAGVGFAALNPELQGVDPEDYSLVYRHRILSDVARGSKEHRATRSEALQAYREGLLSEREKEILETTLSQEEVLSQKKTFYEPPSQRVLNPVGIFQNTLWETMRKNAESPLEMLTPIRPAAKLLHQRTAIEDYIETQLGGTDSAIWTNPFSHFIKPAANKIRQTLTFGGTFLPEEAKEKYNIDEYFDKLDYLRKRRQGSEDYSLTTVIGASLSGLNTKDKILKFKSALSNDQKDYFESFSKETNEKKRDKIREILPEDVRRGYEQIWQNLDIARKAQASGKNVQYELASNISNQTKALSETFKVSLTKEDKEKARKIVERDRDSYVGVGIKEKDRVRFTEDEILRRKMADKESLTYINKRTGVPSTKFVGWDPRLTTDDIKIRTLDMGKEDLKRFGFWDKDEERMRSLRAITEDSDQIFSQIDRIKRELRSEREIKRKIEQTMFSKGFKTSNIQMVDSNYGSILVQEN